MKKHVVPQIAVCVVSIGLGLGGCASVTPGTTHTSSAARLPSSFPAHQVPILAGRLLVASGDAADGWSVTVDPSSGGLASAEAELKSAGFEVTHSSESSATLTGSDYTVLVQTPGKSLTYVVTEK